MGTAAGRRRLKIHICVCFFLGGGVETFSSCAKTQMQMYSNEKIQFRNTKQILSYELEFLQKLT